MKRLLFATLILFLAKVNTTTAQERIKFGLKVGGQITNFYGHDADQLNLDARVGILAGGFAVKKNQKMAYQIELLYSVKGVTFEDNNTKVRLSYIDLPILAKYYILDHLNIHLGPQIGFLAHAGFEDTKVNEQYKSIDIGAIGGIEFDAERGYVIGARYNLGLIEAGEEYVDDSATQNTKVDAKDYKNVAIQAYLGFRF